MGKTRYLMITTEAGIIEKYQDGIKLANSIRIYLKRLAEKKGYFLEVEIGVSENDAHSGKIINEQTGKRGRPRKIYDYPVNIDASMIKDVHLHILIHGNPASSIANQLMKYINKRYLHLLNGEKKSVCMKTDCNDYYEYEYEYVRRQSRTIRTLKVGQEPVENNEEDSQEVCEEYENGFIFTKLEKTVTEEILVMKRLYGSFQASRKVECNYTIYICRERIWISKYIYRYLVIKCVPP